ncbi:surface-adhesin E family protein [Achromobacter ruhlandii]|uniref:surface-adhesin E family protein n=1 Tax=Achromobacter ruhlandii TaxID=72557 RepID=UPI0007BF18BA|nr:surface-adhesin E family protein [Achromobacter ruhlandii]
MTARHALHTLILAMLAGSAWAQPAVTAAGGCAPLTERDGNARPCDGGGPPHQAEDAAPASANGSDWQPLAPQSMPGVFYDGASITQLSERPVVMLATVAWFYAQPRVSETNGQPYGSVTQAVIMNCSNNTYTVTETQHFAGPNATGSLVESLPVAGMTNAPVVRDPVQRSLRTVICPADGRRARPQGTAASRDATP